PRQVWIARQLDLHVPRFAHVALVLGPDGARLAKRHGATSLTEFAEQGIDAPAVLRLLAASIGIEPRDTDRVAADLLDRFDRALVPRTAERIDPARLLESGRWSRLRIE